MAFSLRLPKDLHEDLERIADREYRTLTAQITLYLKRCVDEDRAQRTDDELSDAPTGARR